MSWHFSQALVAKYSADTFSAGAPSAPLSGSPIPQAFLSPDRMKAFSRLSRFGMTCEPLTDDLGEDLLTWFRAASLVRTSAQPAKAQESTESAAACGSTWRESSVKYCLASSGWKTHRCLWEEDLEWSSLTLPKWGMMRVGVLWERTTPEHLTSETESGLLANVPTPTAMMADRSSIQTQAKYVNRTGKQTNIKAWVGMQMWPTPCATDHKGSGKTGTLRDRLDYATERGATKSNTYATPQARDFRTGSTDRWENPERSRNLNDQVGGQLNPTWVEWLMGWPLGWTDLKPLETDKFREWCRSHGISYDNKKISDR